jgi:hypothetical protein
VRPRKNEIRPGVAATWQRGRHHLQHFAKDFGPKGEENREIAPPSARGADSQFNSRRFFAEDHFEGFQDPGAPRLSRKVCAKGLRTTGFSFYTLAETARLL